MNKNNLVLEDFAKNNIINKLATKHFNEKEMKNSRDYKVQFVKISNENNLSGYMLVKQNLNSVTVAIKHKKAKDSKYEIVFAGLRQPTKNISMDSYKVLSLFVSKYKIFDMDICVDGLNEIKINSESHNQHIHLFDNYVKAKKETKIYRSSFYINNPQSIESDTYKIKRVNVYDKYQKESSRKTLNDSYENWKRIEATVIINSHIKGVLMADYIQDVLNLASKYFNANHYDLAYINLQLKILQNGDARRSKKNIELLN
ncbi:MAG: hypothetical protein U9N59_14165 [Campylobacterota bacterium]|nr:hypothetical protein [Campylobacterota bacterium]